MHRCIISLAANCNQKENLAEARKLLGQILFDVRYTRELWTNPVGSVSSQPSARGETNSSECQYLNQLAYACTELSCDELERTLKAVECRMGRTEADRRKGIVRIDLDLMLYDDTRHHIQDWGRPYITQLLRKEVEHQ